MSTNPEVIAHKLLAELNCKDPIVLTRQPTPANTARDWKEVMEEGWWFTSPHPFCDADGVARFAPTPEVRCCWVSSADEIIYIRITRSCGLDLGWEDTYEFQEDVSFPPPNVIEKEVIVSIPAEEAERFAASVARFFSW